MPGIIRWEKPPWVLVKPPKEEINHPYIAWQLKNEPGRSALIYVGSFPLASKIKRAAYACYRPVGSFEAESSWKDGKWHTWAWYVGQDEED